jgi:hypothetical protein
MSSAKVAFVFSRDLNVSLLQASCEPLLDSLHFQQLDLKVFHVKFSTKATPTVMTKFIFVEFCGVGEEI